MIKIVKGFVEIGKSQKETPDTYKRRVANYLYALQASYKGISREIYLSLPDWDHQRVSMLQEEPSNDATEDDILYDYETRDKFVDHHAAHGWNKELNLDILAEHNQEMIVDEHTYIDDGEFVHWLRRETTGELKRLDVYLLKYIDHAQLSDEGITDFNGVLFAEKDVEEVYQKIKRVLTRFTSILQDRRILHSATIERPSMKEVLGYTPNSQPKWIKENESR